MAPWATPTDQQGYWTRKIMERGKFDTLNTHIYDRSIFWVGTCTSITSGMVT
jgi:hypothetical protein